jgi:hypothetical protein
MDDRDRAEMQALCDQFRREMAREVDEPLFDHDARARIGAGDRPICAAGAIGLRGVRGWRDRYRVRSCSNQPDKPARVTTIWLCRAYGMLKVRTAHAIASGLSQASTVPSFSSASSRPI